MALLHQLADQMLAEESCAPSYSVQHPGYPARDAPWRKAKGQGLPHPTSAPGEREKEIQGPDASEYGCNEDVDLTALSHVRAPASVIIPRTLGTLGRSLRCGEGSSAPPLARARTRGRAQQEIGVRAPCRPLYVHRRAIPGHIYMFVPRCRVLGRSILSTPSL